jgi:hypothetical protein
MRGVDAEPAVSGSVDTGLFVRVEEDEAPEVDVPG